MIKRSNFTQLTRIEFFNDYKLPDTGLFIIQLEDDTLGNILRM